MTADRPDEETTRNRAGRERSSDRPSTESTASESDETGRAGPADRTQSGADTDDTVDDDPPSTRADGPPAATGSDGVSDEGEEPTEDEFGPVQDAGPRDIVVPMRLFKLVTVVTTLLAVPTIVLGFMFLDAATLQTSVARATVLLVVNRLGVPIDESVVSILLGFVGVGLIGLGAGIYIVGSRFRAAGMGNAEEDTDEQSANG